jgi:hypothetical protein
MTNKSKIAIKKWGYELALKCFYLNYIVGYGGRTIGQDNGFTTRQADSLIDAGREFWDENLDSEHTMESMREYLKSKFN